MGVGYTAYAGLMGFGFENLEWRCAVTLTAAVELYRAYTWRFKDYGIPNEPPLFLW